MLRPLWLPDSNGTAALDTVPNASRVTYAVSPSGELLLQEVPGGYGIVRRNSPHSGAIPVPGINSLGQFSPDNAWLAATSLQAGRSEVYVISTADPTVRYRVSVDGGEEPRWSAKGGVSSWGIFPDGHYPLLQLPAEHTTHRLSVVTDLPGLLQDGSGPQR